MKVIYNRFIPFGTYHGLNLFGIVFVQRRWGKMEPHELNHEFIHTCQQWEMTYVLFYLWLSSWCGWFSTDSELRRLITTSVSKGRRMTTNATWNTSMSAV